MGFLGSLFGSDSNLREPRFGGILYPKDADALRSKIDALLAEADVGPMESATRALIAPHSDIEYAGPIAASAYASLNGSPDRVVIVGPSRRVPFRGMSVPSFDGFGTPLGPVGIDAAAREAVLEDGQVDVLDEAHGPEPSIEVQLPWLQVRVGEELEVLPVLVGDVSYEDVVAALERVVDDATLLVVASEFSRDETHELASARDRESADVIEGLDPERVTFGMVTARTPVQALVAIASKRGWAAHTLDLRTSGDTAGEEGLVMGYGAMAFC